MDRTSLILLSPSKSDVLDLAWSQTLGTGHDVGVVGAQDGRTVEMLPDRIKGSADDGGGGEAVSKRVGSRNTDRLRSVRHG